MKNIIKLFVVLVFPLYSHASIIQNLDEQNKLQVTFSSSDTNRIAITNGEISRVFGLGEQFSSQYDEATGQLFFKPITTITTPITITIISTTKQTQDIEAKFVEKPGETLLLTEKLNNSNKLDTSNSNGLNPNEKGLQLLKNILEEKITLEKITDKNKKFYKKTLRQFNCTPKYFTSKGHYTAIVYEITNSKRYEQNLNEASFAEKGDILVMFLKNKLLPKEVTKAIVIRSN